MSSKKKQKFLTQIGVVKDDMIIGFNPLTWVVFFIVVIWFTIVGMFTAAKETVIELLDLKFYPTGFSNTKLYKALYWVYDISATYIRYVILRRWNKLNERQVQWLKERNFTGIRKKLLDKIIKYNTMSLLEVYMRGWNDCFDDNDNSEEYRDEKRLAAYKLGWSDSIVGDDVQSLDLQREDEILQRIENYKFS